MSRALIVGGQSQIGSALAETLKNLEWSIVTTSRRLNKTVEDDCLFMDLSDPPSRWPELPAVEAAVICAAITNQQMCEDDPALSKKINVDHTVALAQKLKEAGAFVLLLSTTAVFDGMAPFCKHDTPVSPANAYGRQKAAAEAAVLGDETAAVLRLSKVIGPEMPLLKDWLSDLRGNRPINAFEDMTFAPVTVGFVAEIIDKILRLGKVGVYQASGDRELSYSGFAAMLCDALDVPRSLSVIGRSGNPERAENSTLDMSVERYLFGIEQPSSEAAVRGMLAAVSSSSCSGLVG